MSLINSIFLFALGAAVVPVLIHLVRRIKAQKVPFSTLMFLAPIPEQQVRRRRLQDVLLMLMRAGLLVLLALAFARPFIPQDKLPFFNDEASRSVVLLVDASYSMHYGDAFERARSMAHDELNRAAGNDEFALVSFSDETVQHTPLSQDVTTVRSALDQIETPSYRTTDFFKPFQLAEDILDEARHERKEVVLISDMQRNGWSGAFDQWKLERGIDFRVMSVRDESPENRFVEAVEHSNRRSENGMVTRVDARVRSAGALAGEGTDVQLSIDDVVADETELAAARTRRAVFQHQPEREGTFQSMVQVAGDDLTVDDTYYFTWQVTEKPTFLVVDGAGTRARSDAFFLAQAIDQGATARYGFARGTLRDLTARGLRDYQGVFIANPAQLNNSALSALQRYAEGGGVLILSFGDQFQAPAASGLLGRLELGSAEQVIRARSVFGHESIIGEVDQQHPIFSVFVGEGSGAIFRPRFRQYVQFTPDEDASVVARFDNGDPFLLERRVGEGLVLAYASTWNTDWTDFPVNELYVPFLYQTMAYGLSVQHRPVQFAVGDLVRLDGEPDEQWVVRSPDDRQFQVEIQESGEAFFTNTDVPGHYVAEHGTERFAFSVNVDTKESILDGRDEAEALATVLPPPEDAPTNSQLAKVVALEEDEKQQKLWRYIIFMALLLFGLESYWAHKKRVQKKPGPG